MFEECEYGPILNRAISGPLVQLHGILYAQEYGLDHTFEGYVARDLGMFAQSYDKRTDSLWIAEERDRVVGSIAIAGHSEGNAQLRWFLVHPEIRGQGLGRRLLREAIEFCRQRGFTSVFLWTLSELTAAVNLYKEAGFCLTEQKTHEIWGGVHTEERYELALLPHFQEQKL